ncbi:MAG: rRNA pseudouridine synthase [Ignavibacterium sp.]|nr:rRNA pseudouridine synthase [Ignavibacterium sp.]MCX7611424.1 rRNA pseudouridine synthase [Ignavibacterium sp.]MDW8376374.1 pseudouridine synthase [Ignavibacteriales bacterium]
MVQKIRLNKAIAESGLCSRRKADELIQQNRVTVNGKTVQSLSTLVDPSKDIIEVDGEKIKLQSKVYILLNKPAGYLCTTKDDKKRKTVLDLINIKKRIYPVGRLDYDTTGVLILTNDGDFANLLLHPKNKVPRIYKVKLDKPADIDTLKKLEKGIILDNKKSKFEKIYPVNKDNKFQFFVECVEGRNHFVKNMFQKLGFNVVELHRKSFAIFNDDIPIGSYRFLTDKEVYQVKSIYE